MAIISRIKFQFFPKLSTMTHECNEKGNYEIQDIKKISFTRNTKIYNFSVYRKPYIMMILCLTNKFYYYEKKI